MPCRIVTLAVISGLVAGLTNAAHASDSENWQFRVAPYVWAPALEVTTAIGSSPEAGNSTNLLDILNFALLVQGEARKDRFAVLAEFNYLSVSNDVEWAGGLGKADAGVSGVMAGAGLSYRVTDSDDYTIDPFVGFRIWHLNADVDFDTLPTVSRTTTVIDPIIGVRATAALDEQWSVVGLANIGGFGFGTQFQWDVIGQVNYRFNERWDVSLGYRYLSLDLNRDQIDMSASLGGPFVAVGIRF